MTNTFDLRRCSNKYRTFICGNFSRSAVKLLDVPWDGLKEHKIDPIVEAIQELQPAQAPTGASSVQELPPPLRQCGLKVLLEELGARHPRKVSPLARFERTMDKVLWTYLHARPAFEEAVVFARR